MTLYDMWVSFVLGFIVLSGLNVALIVIIVSEIGKINREIEEIINGQNSND